MSAETEKNAESTTPLPMDALPRIVACNDESEREVIISQNGLADPHFEQHRDLIKKIAQLMFQKGTNRLEASILKSKLEQKLLIYLEPVFQRTENSHCGLLLRNDKNEIESVVFCDKDGPDFWEHKIAALWRQNPRKFPGLADALKAGFPEDHASLIVKIQLKDLSVGNVRRLQAQRKLVGLVFNASTYLILPVSQLSSFIETSARLSVEYFKDPKTGDKIIKQFKEIPLIKDLELKLKDDAWLVKICDFLLREKPTGTQVDASTLLMSMAACRQIAYSRLKDAYERKVLTEKMQADFRAVIEEVKMENLPISPRDLEKKIERFKKLYGERWDEFRSFFTKEAYQRNNQDLGLSLLVMVGESLYHRDILYKLFIHHLDETAERAKREFTSIMFHRLNARRLAPDIPNVLDARVFLDQLTAFVRTDSEFVFIVLTKKGLLENVLYHAIRQEAARATQEQFIEKYSKTSERYFQSLDPVIPKNLFAVLSIDPADVYMEAYKRINVIKRIIYLLTGQGSRSLAELQGSLKKTLSQVAQEGAASSRAASAPKKVQPRPRPAPQEHASGSTRPHIVKIQRHGHKPTNVIPANPKDPKKALDEAVDGLKKIDWSKIQRP